MSTYEHDLLTARFAALAPSALPERLGRRARQGRRGPSASPPPRAVTLARRPSPQAGRRTGGFGARRCRRSHSLRNGARPLPRPGLRRLSSRGSDDERSESGGLVPSFIGMSTTLELRMTSVFVYADGRVIWVRQGGAPAGANKSTSGFLEQRLTPEGVELLRSKVISDRTVPPRRRSDHRERGTSAAGAGTAVPGHDPGTHWRAARPRPLDEPRPPPRRPQRLPRHVHRHDRHTRAGAGARTARSATRRSGSFAAGERVAGPARQGVRGGQIRHLLGASAGAWAGSTSASNPTVPRSDPPPRDSRGRTPPRGPVRWGDNPPTDCSVVPTRLERSSELSSMRASKKES